MKNETAITAPVESQRSPTDSKTGPKAKDERIGTLVANKYKLGQIIGSGSFGELRHAIDVKTNELVAVKLEEVKAGQKSVPLEQEFKCYRMIGDNVEGFPKIFHYGKYDKYNALVMELLDKNLEALFNQCGRQFSLKTTIYVFLQLLQRIERVHSANLVYRDVKPENFLLGREGTNKANLIHIIDFGLAKQYYFPETKTHIEMQFGRSLTGTARYMSINSHLGKEQSRRDDLESIGYMMLYFVRQGKLPWSGLKADSLKQRYANICLAKRATPIETLCYGCPEAFKDYFRLVRTMEFEEKPDYQKLKKLFVKLFLKEKFEDDGLYDWSA